MFILDVKFRKRWQKLSLMEQLGNVGSEVMRTLYWEKRKNKHNMKSAFERALLLLDLTIETVSGSYRLKELLRLREVLGDYFGHHFIYHTSGQDLKNYFLPFAMSARQQG